MTQEPFKNSSTDTASGIHLPEQLQNIEPQTEMKQSSIDFYLERNNALREEFIEGKFNGVEYFKKTLELEVETKAMHKEEIIEAWSNGYDEEDRATSNPIKYYNDTFNNKEE